MLVMRGLDRASMMMVSECCWIAGSSPAMTSLGRGAALAGSTVTLWPRHTL